MLLKFITTSLLMGFTLSVFAITPQDLLKSYEAQSGKASPSRG
jgi:hypothetical protein